MKYMYCFLCTLCNAGKTESPTDMLRSIMAQMESTHIMLGNGTRKVYLSEHVFMFLKFTLSLECTSMNEKMKHTF